jgi:DNA-binding ferritin-like protein (Dps family)
MKKVTRITESQMNKLVKKALNKDKKVVRLTETQLINLIKKVVIKESTPNPKDLEIIGECFAESYEELVTKQPDWLEKHPNTLTLLTKFIEFIANNLEGSGEINTVSMIKLITKFLMENKELVGKSLEEINDDDVNIFTNLLVCIYKRKTGMEVDQTQISILKNVLTNILRISKSMNKIFNTGKIPGGF